LSPFIDGAAADITLSQFCCRRNRPGPNNGSGDSPRPPFLSEFVNQVGEFVFVFLIYHLLGRLPCAYPSACLRAIRRKLNPLCASSSCRLLTPKSASRPSRLPGSISLGCLRKRPGSNTTSGISLPSSASLPPAEPSPPPSPPGRGRSRSTCPFRPASSQSPKSAPKPQRRVNNHAARPHIQVLQTSSKRTGTCSTS
jgi:hypothetical protein